LSYGCSVLLLGAYASWVPRPLRSYEVGVPDDTSAPGTQRFSHSEAHRFEDGSDLDLSWEVDADPDTILTLDLEHPQVGARIVECRANRLTLQLPEKYVGKVLQWRHVTASDHLHGCKHLEGKDLYHRVVGVSSVTASAPPHKGALAILTTKELFSASQMFSHCRFTYSYVPMEAKAHYEKQPPRRLTKSIELSNLTNEEKSILNTTKHSILTMTKPKELSNFAWNWPYSLKAPKNPHFSLRFPGGLGYIRLNSPKLKSDIAMTMNFSSRVKKPSLSPEVNIETKIDGYFDINADIVAAVKLDADEWASMFDSIDQSASTLDNILVDDLNILRFPNVTETAHQFHKVKFFMGGIPVTVKPTFNCSLKVSHKGLLHGTYRVGLKTKLHLGAVMTFNTKTGLSGKFDATATDSSIMPPSWMLFTKRFDLGLMLQPTSSISGGYGGFEDTKDMAMSWSFPSYFNVSIHPEGHSNGRGSTSLKGTGFDGKADSILDAMGFTGQVGQELDKMRAQCYKMKYKVRSGMKCIMKNATMPAEAMGLGDLGSSPDGTSKAIPVYRFTSKISEISNSIPGWLRSILPEDEVEGMLPGCTWVNPINPMHIKHIVVKISRTYKWKDHIGPKMRHIIAYGLSLFPSAIKVSEKMIVPVSSTTSRRLSTTSKSVPLRRLSSIEEEIDGDAENEADDHDDTEFNQFTVRITQPMHFELNEDLLRTLLARGAFRGIQDGREDTHGPIEVEHVSLRDPPAIEGAAARAEPAPLPVRGGRSETSAPQPSTGTQPSTSSLGIALVNCIAGVGSLSLGVTLFLVISRRWGYAPLPPHLVGDSQGLA